MITNMADTDRDGICCGNALTAGGITGGEITGGVIATSTAVNVASAGLALTPLLVANAPAFNVLR